MYVDIFFFSNIFFGYFCSYLLKEPKEFQHPLHFHNTQNRGHNATQILPNLWFARLVNPPKNLFDYFFAVVVVVVARVGTFPFHVPNGTNITSRLKFWKKSWSKKRSVSRFSNGSQWLLDSLQSVGHNYLRQQHFPFMTLKIYKLSLFSSTFIFHRIYHMIELIFVKCWKWKLLWDA